MAEYRPKNRGLERVLGTGALFSTAYGNVGSSIYYALGLVAIYAAGMTPVVFVIAGLIFAATAATYSEATTMFPEAGGSSSFARRAFNEFWSFFAAWAQMLTYIITIAISAFFVPHYLGVFWEPLGESPADIVGGVVVVALLAVVNIVGVKESAGVNIGFAVADFLTQVGLVLIGVVLVLDPELLVEQVDFGTVPTVGDFLIAIPVAMVAYTGIETVSNMAEEARDYQKTIPRGIGLVVLAVAVIYVFLPAIALSAMPVVNGETILAKPSEEGGYADDPILGVVENMDLGALQGPAEIYVGVLAASILFIATNAGIIGVSRLSYSMGQHRQLPELLRSLHPKFRTPYVAIALFGTIACVAILPGQADFLGVIYAFGAMLSFTIAHVSVTTLRFKKPELERPYRAPLNVTVRGTQVPMTSVLGGLGTGYRAARGDRARPARARLRRALACVRDPSLRRLSAPPGPVADGDAQDRDAEARGRARGGVPVGARGVRGRQLLARGGRDGCAARRPAQARHPRARHDHRPGQLADRRVDAPAGAEGRVDHRLGARAGRAARDRPLGEGAPGPGGPPDRRGGEGDQRARDRDGAAAEARRRLVVRPRPRDRAERTALPRDHRLLAGARRPAKDRRSGNTIGRVERAYATSTRLLSALLFLVGTAMVVTALARGGGPLALGVVLGVMLALIGAGRLYLALRA